MGRFFNRKPWEPYGGAYMEVLAGDEVPSEHETPPVPRNRESFDRLMANLAALPREYIHMPVVETIPEDFSLGILGRDLNEEEMQRLGI